MDRIEKALKKLPSKERERLKEILVAVRAGNFTNLDVQKLRGHDDIYRVRKGDMRIIYRIDKNDRIFILAVERRSDITYHRF